MANMKQELGVIRSVVNSFTRKGYNLTSYDIEDLVQEVMVHFLEKKFFEKYNPAQTSYRYFIWVATKNYLITLSKQDKIRFMSLDRVVGEAEDGETFLDMVEDPNHFLVEMNSSEFFDTIVNRLPAQSVSPSYSLSMQELFKNLYLENNKPKDIALRVHITPGRVSQLVKALRKQVRKIVLEEYPEVSPA